MDRRSVLAMTTTAGAALLARDSIGSTHAAGLVTGANRHSYVCRNDSVALFCRDWGMGTPVVFVSSAGMTCDMWAYQVASLLPHGLRCIAFDRRGHGRSSDPGSGYDFDTLADDLAAIVTTLDLQNVTLVGHSMGCAEITRYLTRHGTARVARVAMLAPTMPFLLKTSDHPEGLDRRVFDAVRTQWLHDFPQWVADNTDPFFVPETSTAMKSWAAGLLLQTALQAQIQCSIAAMETDFRQELTRITVPALVLHGTKDVSAPLPLTGQRTARLIPGCQLKVYDGAPHGLFITHMQQVNADLLKFIQS
ncbi:MAG TPA: alpha/beta hydrolase [Povalibacter sp.]|nr:alpha/beta hydrolase [Povalibacter sp.]